MLCVISVAYSTTQLDKGCIHARLSLLLRSSEKLANLIWVSPKVIVCVITFREMFDDGVLEDEIMVTIPYLSTSRP